MKSELIQQRHEDPDGFVRWLLEDTLRTERIYKIEVTSNGPDDLPNRVMYMPADVDEITMIMPASFGPEPLPYEEVAICCAMARSKLGQPFFIAFLAESYMLLGPDDKELPTRRGQLGARFKQGDPNVSETLTITAVHRRRNGTLRTLGVLLPFHYADGSVVFGEESWMDSLEDDLTIGGAVTEEMINAFGSEQN